jgi:hypothetical protein
VLRCARLTDKARSRGDNVQLILLRFAIERLIYRLSQSKYCDDFILKGAMLFSLWATVPYRGTGDLDLLGKGDPAPERMASIFRELCGLSVPDDGLVFDADSITAEPTRAEDEYRGVRVELSLTLAGGTSAHSNRHWLRRHRDTKGANDQLSHAARFP